jgi:porin
MAKGLLVFIILFLVLSVSNPLSAQGEVALDKPVSMDVSYISDNVNNFSGGLKRGYGYLGLVTLGISMDTKSARLWKGGRLYICGASTHGASPSQELIGDIQVASNIEAGSHTYMQELWYGHTLGALQFIAGLQNMNAEFANTEYGALFLNSSFGIHPTISGNIPAPIFPLTSLGFTAKWKVSERIGWNMAFYDGNPIEFANNPYNLQWNVNNGLLVISEIQYMVAPGNAYKGIYKLGFYHHNHSVTETNSAGNVPDHYGFYAVADQVIWQKTDNKKIGLFGQLGYNPKRYNQNYFYTGVGINYYGIFSKKGADILGVAIAHAAVRDIGNETTIELTYQTNIAEKIFIQPDLQYIINPLGTGVVLNNCFTGAMRLGINF